MAERTGEPPVVSRPFTVAGKRGAPLRPTTVHSRDQPAWTPSTSSSSQQPPPLHLPSLPQPPATAAAKERGLYSEPIRATTPEETQLQQSQQQQQQQQQRRPASRQRTPGSAHKLEPLLGTGRHSDAAAAAAAAEAAAAPALVRATEPKVMTPFVTAPGATPRKVVVERKRRLFAAQDIGALLAQEGVVQLYTGGGLLGTVPLECFDDAEFDTRTPAEWAALAQAVAKSAGNPSRGLPARGYMRRRKAQGSDEEWAWVPCQVVGYAADTDEYVVRVSDDEGDVRRLPKILLLFAAEDPFLHTARIKAALSARARAEAALRYRCYVDSMPRDTADGETLLPAKRATRIVSLATSRTSSKKQQQQQTAQTLLEIAARELSRVVNRLVFDQGWKGTAVGADIVGPPDAAHEAAEIDRMRPPMSPQHRRLVPDHIGGDAFAILRNETAVRSFLSRTETLSVLLRVRQECLTVAQTCVFNTRLTKSSRLEEFEQMQLTNMAATATTAVRDTWVSATRNAVVSSLKNLGKGWFNLGETRREVYEISRLKRFNETIRFMMEDSLRTMMQNSLEALAELVETAAEDAVVVNGPRDVAVTRSLHAFETLKFPLFAVDLIADEARGFFLSHAATSFWERLEALGERMLGMFGGITTIERLVMTKLFWSETPTLVTVGKGEPAIAKSFDRIRKALDHAVASLKDYVAVFQRYEHIVKLDKAAYLREFTAKEHSLDEFRQEVQSHLSALAAIIEDVPLDAAVGMFHVNNTSALQFLVDKCKALASGVLEAFDSVTTTAAISVSVEFEGLMRQLEERSRDIEMLSEQKAFVAQLPGTVKTLQRRVDSLMANFELLEGFQFAQPPDHASLRWTLIQWPQRILTRAEEIVLVHEKERSNFFKQYTEAREAFEEKVKDISVSAAAAMNISDLEKHETAFSQAQRVTQMIRDAQEQIKVFNRRERLFAVEQTQYPEFSQLVKQFEPFSRLWTTAHTWLETKARWMTEPFSTLQPEAIEEMLSEGSKTMFRLLEVFKQNPPLREVASQIRDQIEEFKPNMPSITAFRSPAMRPRHWKALKEQLGIDLQFDEAMTLQTLLQFNLVEEMPVIQKMLDVANKEYVIEAALQKLERDWADVRFELKPHVRAKTFTLSSTDDISQQVDDNLVMIQTMAFSAFKGPFEEQIAAWETKLRTVMNVLDEWLYDQRQWLSLEPIFCSDDINRQLPAEGKRYTTADGLWRRLMDLANRDPRVVVIATQKKTLEDLVETHKLLDMIQFGLSEYIATKQGAFPRFYFLSNKELLEILSQTRDPTSIQPYLHSAFENIHRLEFQADNKITAMLSAEGERIEFVNPFYPSSFVENWLLEVEAQMRVSVRHMLTQAINDHPNRPRAEWILSWPGQCVLAANTVYWTRDVTEAIRKGRSGLKALREKLVSQLGDLTRIVRQEHTTLERLTLGSLIVMDIHQRDVVAELESKGISDEHDFEWEGQLRYYWEKAADGEADLFVRIVSAVFNYGHEYLGNSTRLVITPLTDRAYMTLTSALHMQLGGAPQGPAGTGKTETTKDLAKALAKLCIVFNCSSDLTHHAMAKFFKGVASSGAWACLDEFNRIELEVLSVVAEQIGSIQRAMQAGLKSFTLAETVIPLDKTCGVFITMNPGYAGRTELPDNLKALFRPIAMMVPDFAMIAEIKLVSYGFDDSRSLARKIVATFRLSSEQLSPQDHYDFGMRALNTVLSAAGNLKRQYPTENEPTLIIRALRDCNVPKFLAQDIPLFEGILSDLFPGLSAYNLDYTDLIKALHEATVAAKLQPVPTFIAKCIQLYETMAIRHGVMLVGPASSGKTTAYRVLAAALNLLHSRGSERFNGVRYSVLNPKSVTLGQLYGELHKTTLEWSEGVLAVLVRDDSRDTTPIQKWIVCDGPVDANWIENMNTVLDDNKKLCITSGEIITMSRWQTIMFEVENLAGASPATVSRCGMVYMEPGDIGIGSIVKSGIQKLPDAISSKFGDTIQALFDRFLEPSLDFLRKNMTELVATTDIHLTMSLMNMLECTIAPWLSHEQSGEGEEPSPLDADILAGCFVFSLVWSVGATTDNEGRKLFDQFLRLRMAETEIVSSVPFPATDGSCYDYRFDAATKRWVPWMESAVKDLAAAASSLSAGDISQIMVPTIDTVRYQALLELLVRRDKQVMIVGPTTGKSSIIRTKLFSGMPERYQSCALTFSGKTSANQTQDIIEGKLEKRRKGVLGPIAGHKLVVFVDDVHMPRREEWGAQPPIEILRQWLDHRGWYDLKAIQQQQPPFKEIADTILVCAMTPPGGGRQAVGNRFLRHFNIIATTQIQPPTLRHIYTTLLTLVLQPFPEAVRGITSSIVAATLEVYAACLHELLPTPAKSHYLFGLRDLSKIFQGMASAHVSVIKAPEDLACLWWHECTRVFQDRLVDTADAGWFQDTMKKALEKTLGFSFEKVIAAGGPMIFGDFLDRSVDVESRVYCRMSNREQLLTAANEALEFRNQMSETPLKMVMFMNAIEHVARLNRVLRQPQGHALLLGLGGSGRKSCAYLAASMAEYQVVQMSITGKYGQAEWKDDLKKVLRLTGLDQKNVVFILDDSQIRDETFFEDINNILNNGDVPNLWAPDELDAILSQTSPLLAQSLGTKKALSKEAIYNYFLSIVRSHIHVVLCLSPVAEQFNERLRLFPSLVSCTTIDWYAGWPDDALSSVAESLLEQVVFPAEGVRSSVVKMCIEMFRSVETASAAYLTELNRHNYVTPTSFLEMLNMFKTYLGAKQTEIDAMRKRLLQGLEKLKQATDDVQTLQSELLASQPLLEQSTKDIAQIVEQVDKDTASADEVRQFIMKEEEEARKTAEEAHTVAVDAQQELDQALPALKAAEEGLQGLNKNDITEVRSMLRPPAGVKMVMEAVCILKGVKPKKVDAASGKPGAKELDYWDGAKLMLNDPNFLTSLMTFDKDSIPEAVIQKLQPYIQNDEFRPYAISKVSKACTSLCVWVRAIERYYHVARAVAPKRQRLEQAEKMLAEVNARLAETKANLADIDAKLRGLKEQKEAKEAERQEIERKIADCKAKLERAETLTVGLGEERLRWMETEAELQKRIANLIGDALVSAGTSAFLGVFTGVFRARLLEQWHEAIVRLGIPHTTGCTIRSTLGDAARERQMIIDGLPSDAISIENALIALNAGRYPLLIDPQGQGNKWIRKLEKTRGLDIIKPNCDDFARTLENAIQFGRAVLIENVGEELDPILDTVLQKQVSKQGGNTVIKFGDAKIPFHDDFRLYLTTKLPNPHYKPEISTKVTLINFTITPEGLHDQLLGLVVSKERPDLEESKNQLVLLNASALSQLRAVEDKMLQLLSESAGNPLEDLNLIQALAEAKKTAQTIKEKMKESEENERSIDIARRQFDSVAAKSTVMFFCVTDLALIDPMYQYSLSWFVNLFGKSIKNAEASDQLAQRLENLTSHFLYSLYANVCRGLFVKDKLMFSFLLCVRLLQSYGEIDNQLWRFLIAGASSVSSAAKARAEEDGPNPAPDWLDANAWRALTSLGAAFEHFNGIALDMASNLKMLRAYIDSANPLEEELPDPWQTRLTLFHRVALLRCLRPDAMTAAVQTFVSRNLGPRFAEPPDFDLASPFKDSAPNIALVFILSPGADPMAELMRFAEEMRFSRKLHMVSLGQGQGPRAQAMVQEAMEKGLWVLLANAHLAASWMPTLEAIVDGIQLDKVHKDFRLWLTSMPTSRFPISVLQSGVKMTIEPPKGLKANMVRAFAAFDESFISSIGQGVVASTPERVRTWRKLLYSLCFFHSVVLERRKFGPLGWNIPYEFTTSDLTVSIRQLRASMSEFEDVPYPRLRFIVGVLNYGGRVTDEWDLRTLRTLLSTFFRPDVLEDGFSLCQSGKYVSPPAGTLRDYMVRIRQLSINDAPDAFGMHENADTTYYQAATQALFDTILLLEAGSSASHRSPASVAVRVREVASDITSRVPEKVRLARPLSDDPRDSMTTVLSQEIKRYNGLLRVVHSTLKELVAAFRGLVVMSPALEQLASSIFDNQVPAAWASKGYPSLMPLGSWVADLCDRIGFLERWAAEGLPISFWLPGFFFPQAFLTGVLQTYARRHTVSIDTISFDTVLVQEPLESLTSPPPEGCYIHGLYLEGARFDPIEQSLAESLPKRLYERLPVIWLKPVVNRVPPQKGVYKCPVYKTLSRAGLLSTTGHSTNCVMTIELPSKCDPDFWIQRGAAAFCSLRDK